MKLWDLRAAASPIAIVKRHNAGVTSAQWHPRLEHVFASGSYDEFVRIWDDRMLVKPLLEIHTGNRSIKIAQNKCLIQWY